MQQMQADTVMIDAQFFVPEIVASFERSRLSGAHPSLAGLGASPAVGAAVQRLAQWDFSSPTGIEEGYDASDVNGARSAPSSTEIANSVAATIYSVWRGQILANTVDALFGPQRIPVDARPPAATALSALKRLFQTFPVREGRGGSGLSFFNVPGVEDAAARRDILVLKSVADTIALLSGDEFAPAFDHSTNFDDYRWGKLHRVVFRHDLVAALGIPPAGGAWPHPLGSELPGIPTDGGFGAVDASSHNARAAGLNSFMFGGGPVRRLVAEGGGGTLRSESSLPGGPSGRPTSPFFFSLLPMWLTNETYTQHLQSGFDLPFGRR
jgi:penicillin amidase